MNKRLFLAAAVAVVVVAVAARVWLISAEAKKAKEGVETIQRREGYPVEVVKVEKGVFEVWREVHGMLMATKESHLRTGDPARIKSVDCQVGDLVTADTPLIRLDPEDPRNLTRVRLAKQVYEEARSDYEKYRRLAQEDAVPRDAVSKMKLKMEAAKSDYDLALSGVELTSSIDGVVTALNARVGERADKDTDLAVVSSLDPLRFSSQVSDADAAAIRAGQAARVRTPEGGEEKGEVIRVSLRAEPKNSMFDLEIAVENPKGALKIGTYVTAEVRVVNLVDAVYVDYRCLVTGADGEVFIFQVKDGKAKKVPVKVVAANQDYAAVEAAELDLVLPVVLRGKEQLQDGVKVMVVEAGGGK